MSDKIQNTVNQFVQSIWDLSENPKAGQKDIRLPSPEGDLKAQVETLQACLLAQSELTLDLLHMSYEKKRKERESFDHGMAEVFLRIAPQISTEGVIRAKRDCVEREAGTPEAANLASEELSCQLSKWLTNALEYLDCIPKWTEKDLATHKSQLAEIERHQKEIARLDPYQFSRLCEAKIQFPDFAYQAKNTIVAYEALRGAITTAQSALASKAPPAVSGAAIESVIRLSALAGEMEWSLRDTQVTLEANVENVLWYIKCIMKEDAQTQSGTRSSVDDEELPPLASAPALQTGAPHREDSWEDYAQPQPTINPASGLFMNGMVDTAGNFYGTNFSNFDF